MIDPVKLAATARRRETSPWVSLFGGALTGIILAAGGVWLMSYTLREGAGDGTPTDMAVGLIVGLFIAVAGVGVMIFGFRTGTRTLEVGRRRKAHPGEPWRWRPEWDDATLESTNRTKVLVAWGVTVPLLLFTLPSGILAVEEIRAGNAAAWVAFAFPLLALGMLVHAIRSTARYRRYGTTELAGVEEDAVTEVAAAEVGTEPTPETPALERPDPRRVRIEETSSGMRLTYPVGSRRGEAAGLLRASLLGLGMGVALYFGEAPALIWATFAGLGGLMATIGVCLWLVVWEVRVTSEAIELGSGLVRPWGTTRISADRIERVHLGEGSRSGDVTFWKVVARMPSGVKHTLGTGMREWSEAAWIADRVARTIGVPFDRSVS